MKESHYLYKESLLNINDRVTVKTTAKIDGHTLDNDDKYNPWGIGGTIIGKFNKKMPELPYIVKWDTGYTNSYQKDNLVKI